MIHQILVFSLVFFYFKVILMLTGIRVSFQNFFSKKDYSIILSKKVDCFL